MTAHELVAKTKNVRLASQAALQLVSLLDQPDTSNESVVQILRCDNVLTAKLLRACNAPLYGFSEPVSSVDQAVFLLGHQQILQLVLTLEFSGAMAVPLPGYAVESKELWHHSLAAASAAEVIVKSGVAGDAETGVAFTVGLLHDIGKLVLNQVLTEGNQADIRSRIGVDKLSRVEAEKQVLGTDHAEVGAALLQNWRLPEQIIEGVRNHHDPLLKPRPALSAVAYMANVMAHLAGSAPGWDAYAIEVDGRVTAAFEMSPDMVEGLVLSVRETFERVDELMSFS
jgi:putative nucleotidyltransferase with HDIG domain